MMAKYHSPYQWRGAAVILLLGVLVIPASLNNDLLININKNRPLSAGFWVENGPLVISNFLTTNSTKGWVFGSGTELDPYRIENVTFDGLNSGDSLRIFAPGYVHFKNCTFKNSGEDYDNWGGLEVQSSSTYIEVEGCQFLNNSHGINFLSSSYANIHDNEFYNNIRSAIRLRHSDNAYVYQNTIENNSYYGIDMYYSQEVSIISNTIVNSSYGAIRIQESTYTNITNNNLTENNRGIRIEPLSHYAFIRGNRIDNVTYSSGEGISVASAENATIEQNYVNSAYYGILISSSTGHFINENRANSCHYGYYISSSEEVVLEYNNATNFTYGGTRISDSSYISFCHGFLEPESPNAGTFDGIYLRDSDNITLTENYINNSYQHGIQVYDNIFDTVIKENTIIGSRITGINVDRTTNENISINENFISGCESGISTSSSAIISENSMVGNQYSIRIDWGANDSVVNDNFIINGTSNCINVWYANNTQIVNNTVMDWTDDTGLYLLAADNSVIEGNFFSSSAGEGIYIAGYIDNYAINTSIVRNTLYTPDNLVLGSNPYYTGIELNNSIGNYWDGYGGIDANSDGIGDTPHSEDSLNDERPLVVDFYTVLESSPNDTVEIGDSTTLEWTVMNNASFIAFPPRRPVHTGVLYKDYSEFLGEFEWDLNSPIEFDTGILEIGTHYFTLECETGYWTEDLTNTVEITVSNTAPALSDTYSFSGMEFLEGTTGNYANFTFSDPSFSGALINITVNDTLNVENSPLASDTPYTLEMDSWGPGTFNLLVEVSDGYGESDSLSASITVIERIYPLPNFNVNASRLLVDQVVAFTYTGSSGNFGVEYIWDFGDGSPTSALQNPVHQYTAGGTYSVSLTLINGTFSTGTAQPDLISVSIDTTPDASFTANSTSIITGGSFAFIFGGSVGNGDESYRWDFGDGSPASDLQNATHQYMEPGTYTVVLTVTDWDGDIDTFSMNITVEPTPIPEEKGGGFWGIFLGISIPLALGVGGFFYFKKHPEKKNALIEKFKELKNKAKKGKTD